MNKRKLLSKLITYLIAVAMVVTLIPAVPACAAVSKPVLTLSLSDYEVKGEWTSAGSKSEICYYEVFKAEDNSGKPRTFRMTDYRVPAGDLREFYDWEAEATKTYHYKVIAYNYDDVKVAQSNVVKFCIPLYKPGFSMIAHDAATGCPVIYAWADEQADRIDVYRSKSKSGSYVRLGACNSKNQYTDKTAASGTTYYYKLKAIYEANRDADSDLSGYRSGEKVKAEPSLAKAIANSVNSNGYLVGVSTLDETLKLTSTANINSLIGYDGGPWLEGRKNNVPLSQIYNLSKIEAAGGTLQNRAGLGDPYFGEQTYIVKKNGISYNYITGRTYGVNVLKVRKGSTPLEINTLIKETAKKYYPTSKWTIYAGKYSPNTVKYASQVKIYKPVYDKYTKKSGYGSYVSNKYYLSIKNKSNSNKKGWTFITVVPTLSRLSTPVITIKNLDGTADMKVSWKKVSGANKYEVWKKIGSNGTYKKAKTTTSLSYRDKSTVKGKKYYYKVKAIKTSNSTQNSPFSTTKSLTCK